VAGERERRRRGSRAPPDRSSLHTGGLGLLRPPADQSLIAGAFKISNIQGRKRNLMAKYVFEIFLQKEDKIYILVFIFQVFGL
jgi:hypothetical protein